MTLRNSMETEDKIMLRLLKSTASKVVRILFRSHRVKRREIIALISKSLKQILAG